MRVRKVLKFFLWHKPLESTQEHKQYTHDLTESSRLTVINTACRQTKPLTLFTERQVSQYKHIIVQPECSWMTANSHFKTFWVSYDLDRHPCIFHWHESKNEPERQLPSKVSFSESESHVRDEGKPEERGLLCTLPQCSSVGKKQFGPTESPFPSPFSTSSQCNNPPCEFRGLKQVQHYIVLFRREIKCCKILTHMYANC